MVQAFISTRLDYCSSLLYGITELVPMHTGRSKCCSASGYNLQISMSRQFWGSFTGHQSGKEWILNWLFWCSKHCMALHLHLFGNATACQLVAIVVTQSMHGPSVQAQHMNIYGIRMLWYNLYKLMSWRSSFCWNSLPVQLRQPDLSLVQPL